MGASLSEHTKDASLSSSTPMDSLNTTDSSPCTLRLSSLASLTSVRSDCLPSCSLWRRRCGLAVYSPFLSLYTQSALSYTVWSPSSHISFSTCANLKCTYTFVSVRSIKIFGIWPHVRRQTYLHVPSSNVVTLVWGSLRLAPIMVDHLCDSDEMQP